MSMTVFNQEVKKLIKRDDHPVLRYVNEKFNEKKHDVDYFGFFDTFLYQYGIQSLGYSPVMKDNKYLPYVNCTRNNVFHEQKGITDLSKVEQNATESQKTMAHYLIRRLKSLHVENFKDWNSEFNFG